MKIGIFGGTFNPPHLGHLIAAEQALEAGDLDEVWFVPTYCPPHKAPPEEANAQDRLAMLQLAVEGHPYYRVKDLEIRRGGISYSVHTVRELCGLHPAYHFYYIIGGDMVQYLPKWHEIDEIARHVRIIGIERPGYEVRKDHLPDWIAERVMVAPMPMIEISSTDIRERRMHNQSVRYRVPETVRQYMEAHGLYV